MDNAVLTQFEGLSHEQIVKKLKEQVNAGYELEVVNTLQLLAEEYPDQAVYKTLLKQYQSKKEHATHVKASNDFFSGQGYLDWLKWFHATLKPKTYLEIGVESGKSLAYAQNPTLSIGVDPQPKIVHEQDSWVKVFAMPSDDFFYTYNVEKLFNSQKIDFSFIDGLHTFDQALKDFMNVERNANENTVAVFHDIYPVTPITAARERVTQFWLGDTWKVVPLLKAVRPDLNIFTIPTAPSGLTVVTGLNPNSSYLKDNIALLTAEWMPIELEDYPDLVSALNVIENNEESVLSHLRIKRSLA